MHPTAFDLELRLRTWMPPPQVFEQLPKLPHESQMQTLVLVQFGNEQDCVSLALPLQGRPPLAANVLATRIRFCNPAQILEQVLKLLQSPQTQSTGQACTLQVCASVVLPWQGAPPPAAEMLTLRSLVWVPAPQGLEQVPKPPQDPQTHSVGHNCTLQGCDSLKLPTQAAPPFAAAVWTLRLLL